VLLQQLLCQPFSALLVGLVHLGLTSLLLLLLLLLLTDFCCG